LPCFPASSEAGKQGSREASLWNKRLLEYNRAASLLPCFQRSREAALKGDAVPCCAEGKAQQGKAQNSQFIGRGISFVALPARSRACAC